MYAKSYEEALIELKKMQYQIKSKIHIPIQTNQTVADWFEEWLKTYGVIAYKNTTYNTYQSIISRVEEEFVFLMICWAV